MKIKIYLTIKVTNGEKEVIHTFILGIDIGSVIDYFNDKQMKLLWKYINICLLNL